MRMFLAIWELVNGANVSDSCDGLFSDSDNVLTIYGPKWQFTQFLSFM